MRNIVVMVALVFASVAACSAATTIYGVTGLVETPDDSIAAVGAPQLAGMYSSDFLGYGDSGNSYGGAIGVLPKLELSAVEMDTGFATRSVVNAKYRFAAESLVSPSITFGVVDAGENLDDDVSAFVVIGKNLTSIAEGVAGKVIMPVRGTIGFGSGIYKGGFAGLTISATPKMDLVVEYLDKGIRDKCTFNSAVRFNPVQGLNITAGLLDMSDLYGSVTYTMLKY